MADILLKELYNSDLQWLVATGEKRDLQTGTVLVPESQATDCLHILLEGTLSLVLPQTEDNPLSRAYAAVEGSGAAVRELARLSSGEVVGDVPFVHTRPSPTAVKAVSPSVVISIPQQPLASKLRQDAGFAARFYRAIAIQLAERLTRLTRQVGRSNLSQGQPLKDVLYLFSELHDSDVDWFMAVGSQQAIAANAVLIQAGIPVDALYILLEGTLSLMVSEDERNPLARAFAAIEEVELPGREITRLSKGGMVGESPFLDSRLPEVAVRALEESQVLMVPRQPLIAKLQQDFGFASRFYRVVAILLSHRFQGLLSHLGCSRRVYSSGRSLSEAVEYEEELDLETLDRVGLAGARFDWMLKHLTKKVEF
jgi:bacteriocin-type transport-associated protein